MLVVPWSMAAMVFMLFDEPHNLQAHGFGSIGHYPVRRRQDFGADFPGQGQVQRIQSREGHVGELVQKVNRSGGQPERQRITAYRLPADILLKSGINFNL